jgi:shikimate kinase
MKQHLFLIGYRGSGKTTIGRRLADRWHLPFTDSDEWIERQAGKSIRSIFAEDGEEAFRALEVQAIEQLSLAVQPSVISLGGGAILRSENRRRLRERGLSVWLQASPSELAQRIQADQTTADRRPALTTLDGIEEIIQVLKRREPWYRETADLSVDTSGRPLEAIVDEIAAWIGKLEIPLFPKRPDGG